MRRNSSTFNSKTAVRRVLLFLALILCGMIAIDLALTFYVGRRTTATSFIEDSHSKAAHMRLRMANARPDIVFIGSSRTIFHISTEEFARNGLNVYNYGVSGCQIASYPFMVGQATELGPARVVISASVLTMGGGELSVPDLPTFTDLRAEIATGQSLMLISGSAAKLLVNLHKLHRYSQPLNLRLRNLFNSLDRPLAPEPPTAAQTALPSDQRDDPVVNLDCTVFDTNMDRAGMRICKCTNGDGVLLGQVQGDEEMPPLVWTGIDESYLALLNYCLDMARDKGVEPVLVLEPVYGFSGFYDLEAIQEAVHARVLDFTRFSLPSDMWANYGHLNAKGRGVYSEALAQAFADLPPPEPDR